MKKNSVKYLTAVALALNLLVITPIVKADAACPAQEQSWLTTQWDNLKDWWNGMWSTNKDTSAEKREVAGEALAPSGAESEKIAGSEAKDENLKNLEANVRPEGTALDAGKSAETAATQDANKK